MAQRPKGWNKNNKDEGNINSVYNENKRKIRKRSEVILDNGTEDIAKNSEVCFEVVRDLLSLDIPMRATGNCGCENALK